jgi:hypothetical protein
MFQNRKKFELTNAHLLDYSNVLGTISGSIDATSTSTTGASDTITTNIAPIANAGSNSTITLPTSTVNLNGSLSNDPDGTINTYSWKQLNGPNTSSITNATSPIAVAGNLVAGTYTYELTVTDNLGATGKASVIINVNPAPAISSPSSGGLFIPPTTISTLGSTTPATTLATVTPSGTLVSTPTGNILVPNPSGGIVTSGGGFGGGGGVATPDETATKTDTKTDGGATPSANKILGMPKKVALWGGLGLLLVAVGVWKRKDIMHLIKG